MFEDGTPMDSEINWKLDFKQKYSYMANDDFIKVCKNVILYWYSESAKAV